MSVTGISGSNNSLVTQNHQQTLEQVKTEIHQLGIDLQTGNLSQARQNFTALSQNFSGAQQSAINQDFSALGQALRSSNLADAQNAYSKLVRNLHQAFVQGHYHYHHRQHAPSWHGSSGEAQPSNSIVEAFAELGKVLESGDLSRAQQVYSTIQQALQQYGLTASAVSRSGAMMSAANFER
jgi:hypothetical protein